MKKLTRNNNSNLYNNNNQNPAWVINQMMLNMMNKNINKIEQIINQRKVHQKAKANLRQQLKNSKEWQQISEKLTAKNSE